MAARRRRFLILGFGSIARTFLPMLRQTLDLMASDICVLSQDEDGAAVLGPQNIRHIQAKLLPEDYVDQLSDLVDAGDVIINLTGGVSARDLVHFALTRGIDYIDTSNERWEFGATYGDSADFAQQWDMMISDRDILPKNSTALVSHGANPGLVSHFAKQAVEELAREEGLLRGNTEGAEKLAIETEDWSELAQRLGITAFHISERDTQCANGHLGNTVCNTWSVEGLLEECHSAPCLAWGSAETELASSMAVRRDRVYDVAHLPGSAKNCTIRSWVPSLGGFDAMITPHEETFSIAELFTSTTGQERYQPTVLFAYRPCRHARTGLARGEQDALDAPHRVISSEIVDGFDELGVLVLREGGEEVYWYGSTLSIEQARGLFPAEQRDLVNATGVQVAAGVLGGLVWILNNPNQGLVSAEHCDHHDVLRVASPWLGDLGGVSARWRRSTMNTSALMGDLAVVA